jgi:hypothetical protein
LRELAAAAHEEELRRALLPVAAAFEEWRSGQLGSGELTERIHEFHQGPARELYKRYNSGPLEFAVAQAIVAVVFERAAVPAEVLEHCRAAIEFLEQTHGSD